MKRLKFLVLFILVFGIVSFTSCTMPPMDENENGEEPIVVTNLEKPLNLIVNVEDYVRISFREVENASGYEVFLYDSQQKLISKYNYTENFKIDVKTLENGKYSIAIRAVGDQERWYNSLLTDKVDFEITDGNENGGGGTLPDNLSAYYKSVEGKTGSALKAALRQLITSTHKKRTTYDDCKRYLQQADADPKNSQNMLLFYTGESVRKSDNMNIWNREHVWAQSLGWFKTSGAGADLHHIRPCNPGVNSSRGNKKFGTGSSYYTPKDNYKGDVARIIFYLLTRYPESDSYSFTSIAQSREILLQWNELDPVSEIEINRNNYIYTIQGNRNPFIDYPEFASSIWK